MIREVKSFNRGKLTQEQFVEAINLELQFNTVFFPIQWNVTGNEITSAVLSYESERVEPPTEEEEEVLVAAAPSGVGRKARRGTRNPVVEGFEDED